MQRREVSEHLEESRTMSEGSRLNRRRTLPRGRDSGERNGVCVHKEAEENMGFSRSCEEVTWGPVGMRQEKVVKAQDEKDPQGQKTGPARTQGKLRPGHDQR